MLEQFPFYIALVGSTVAAAYDLKTTEIPDKVFYVMLALGAPIILYLAVTSQDFFPFFLSLGVGAVLLGFGFLMYKSGQWGGADAKLLAVLGFLLPQVPSGFSPNLLFPFPLSLLLNIFLIGTPYILFYAFIISLNNKQVSQGFFSDMKANAKFLFIGSTSLFIILLLFGYFLTLRFDLSTSFYNLSKNSLIPVGILLGMYAIYKFAKNVEDHAFKIKIPVSKLRVGDILLRSKELEGITIEQLRKVKKSKIKYVWIKSGVRFAPAFPMALLFTVFYGDSIIALSRLLIGF